MRPPDLLSIAAAFAGAWALFLLASPDVPVLGHDGFYYLGWAKTFTHEWPDRFGTSWPFGYPLLGAALARLGVAPYAAMVSLSAASLLGVMILGAALLRAGGEGGLRIAGVLMVFAACPQVYLGHFSVASEPLFSLALLVVAWALARWSWDGWSHGLAWLAALLALLVRYAGGFLWPLLLAWLGWVLRRGGGRRVGRAGVSAAAIATALACGLLYLNVARSGHFGGAERPPGVWTVWHALDLGLSPVGVFSAGVADRIRQVPALHAFVGGVGLAAMITICVQAVRSARRPHVKALATLVLAYLVAMVVFRSVSEFDDLHNGRTLLPVLLALGVLAVHAVPTRWTGALTVVGVLCVVAGAVQAVRGVSPRTHGDPGDVLPALVAAVAPGDVVAVNGSALWVSAYTAAPVQWLESAGDLAGADHVVIGAPALDRAGTRVFEPSWLEAVERAVRSGAHVRATADGYAIVLRAVGR